MEQHTRIGVYGLCLNDDLVLLTKLWDRYSAPGHWTLPGGGLEFGEHPEETLVREFYEETGLACDIGAVMNIGSTVVDPSRKYGRFQGIQIVYRVNASGEPRVVEENGSTVDARWVDLEQARTTLPTMPLVDIVLELI